MAKEYAASFYGSKRWQRTRKAYAKSVGGLCERCRADGVLKPGEIVHHKIHLTPENINNPNITLSWNNLELLCKECHALEHEADIYNKGWLDHIKAERNKRKRRYYVDDNGELVVK